MELEAIKPRLQDDWLRFEILLSDLSARFMRLKSAQADEEIERALREVTEFFHAHRCGLLEVFDDQKVARLTHAWYAEGSGEFLRATIVPRVFRGLSED